MATCPDCGSTNRTQAHFCRFCGRPLAAQARTGLDGLVGLSAVKDKLAPIVSALQVDQLRKRSGLLVEPQTLQFVFLGSTGTGKTRIAQELATTLKNFGALPRGGTTERQAADLVVATDSDAEFLGWTTAAQGGVLIVDGIHLVPEFLGAFSKLSGTLPSDLAVVFCGLSEAVDEYFVTRPDIYQRLSHVWHFADFSSRELAQMCRDRLQERDFLPEDSFLNDLEAFVVQEASNPLVDYRNGWLVERHLVQKIRDQQNMRLSQLTNPTPDDFRKLVREDLPLPLRRPPEEIFHQLDTLIGLTDVKNQVQELFDFLRLQEERRKEEGKAASISIHLVFSGNPGTGKTTVAELMGQIFYGIGFLPTPKVVICVGADLKGSYVGHSKDKVHDYVNRAIGGVLFIDEAYSLTPESGLDSFSQEALDTLTARLESDRGKFVCIVAGYENEMKRFLKANAGLPSRFREPIVFPDYLPAELRAIFESFAHRDGYVFSPTAQSQVLPFFREVFDQREERFGNARVVRNYWNDTIKRHAVRLRAGADGLGKSLIDVQDLPPTNIVPASGDPMAQLRAMIGLETIKSQVASWAAGLQVEMRREQAGARTSIPSLHLILTGNPGTGKTTVAQLLGGILKQLGILKKGHTIMVDASGLVAGYVGQTSLKTQAKINEALGGVLFIDEAYALVPKGSGTNFGQEAIDTLLKRMSDDLGKFVVIAAGYPADMERFVNSNPGFPSRFTKTFHLEDYDPEELTQIYFKVLKDFGWIAEDGAKDAVLSRFQKTCDHKGSDFANGRTARNHLEADLERARTRIAGLSDPTTEQLSTLALEDLN